MKFTTFLWKMFKIGCIGFGGGSALIPVMEEQFIGEGKLDTKEHFDNDIIVANLTPGALPVELASALGKRNFGYKGMILGAAMMALPGIFATLILLTILANLQNRIESIIKCAVIGISSFVIFLIWGYIQNVIRDCKTFSKKFYFRASLVMVGVFILSCGKNLYRLLGIDREPVFGISTIYILLAAFAGIFCIKFIQNQKNPRSGSWMSSLKQTQVPYKEIIRELRTWLLFLAVCSLPALILFPSSLLFLLKGVLSVLASFGGGDAYLVIADGLFVSNGMLSEDFFYGQLVPVVNLLPGTILGKTLTAAGYSYGLDIGGNTACALALALAAFACMLAVSCGVFGAIYQVYDQFSKSQVLIAVSHYIRPIISGLLGNVILLLLNQGRQSALHFALPPMPVVGFILFLAVLDWTLAKKARIKPVYFIGINVLLSFAFTGAAQML